MRLDNYSEKDGRRVWLTVKELDMLIEEAQNPEQRIAFMLAGKAGLRRGEIISVRIKDFENAPDGFVRIKEDFSKSDQYREAPIPDELEYIVETYAHGVDRDRQVIYNDNQGKPRSGATIYRWVRSAAERIQERVPDDEGWEYLDVHDLRRSWGGHLLWNCGVLPTVVMEFGGWSDWQTFANHYMGRITPQAAERERAKIDYMGGEPVEDTTPFTPPTPAATKTYGQK